MKCTQALEEEVAFTLQEIQGEVEAKLWKIEEAIVESHLVIKLLMEHIA